MNVPKIRAMQLLNKHGIPFLRSYIPEDRLLFAQSIEENKMMDSSV
jgi:hypothetical protein